MSIIYLDMDGVLVDLDRHVESLHGTFMRDMTKEQRNRLWMEDFDPAWFRDAPPMPDMDRLLKYVTGRYKNIRMLTALPNRRPDMALESMRAKVEWAHRHVGHHIPVTFGPFAIDKQKHCLAPTSILIDDNRQNIAQWGKVGGIAIFHENADTTIRILEGL